MSNVKIFRNLHGGDFNRKLITEYCVENVFYKCYALTFPAKTVKARALVKREKFIDFLNDRKMK